MSLKISREICNGLACLLHDFGVEEVVTSPGSRNALLISSLSQHPKLRLTPIVDERVAAFFAMGKALQSQKPVAIVCTSGTALLNYAPAVAEAYYRKVPLIVISADRPAQWIDQDDSQTLRQPGALSNIVKKEVDIPTDLESGVENVWLANRLINETLAEAITGVTGPVHINIHLGNFAVDSDSEVGSSLHKIERIMPRHDLTQEKARQLASVIASKKRVLVVAGFMAPNHKLNQAITEFAGADNVAVLTETVANLHSDRFISRIDAFLAGLSREEKTATYPDLIITCGGALISRHIKEYLRQVSSAEHWHIGPSRNIVDCFMHLSAAIEVAPQTFFRQIVKASRKMQTESDYRERCMRLYRKGIEQQSAFIDQCPWSDIKVFKSLAAQIPQGWTVHLSNGTPIRYAQLMDFSHIHRCECNRGVSGIDGSTSTALGSASVNKGKGTLLISGDLSALYDLNALSCAPVANVFRMIVINNGGGDIFRFIRPTRNLPERERLISVSDSRLPLEALARFNDWHYTRVEDEPSLQQALKTFFRGHSPAFMEIVTSKELNTKLLTKYFEHNS